MAVPAFRLTIWYVVDIASTRESVVTDAGIDLPDTQIQVVLRYKNKLWQIQKIAWSKYDDAWVLLERPEVIPEFLGERLAKLCQCKLSELNAPSYGV